MNKNTALVVCLICGISSNKIRAHVHACVNARPNSGHSSRDVSAPAREALYVWKAAEYDNTQINSSDGYMDIVSKAIGKPKYDSVNLGSGLCT